MLLLPMSPEELTLVWVASAIGAMVQGTLGFGMAMIAAPILMMINPALMPSPIMVPGTILVTLIALRERQAAVAADVILGTIGYLIGMLPAAFLVSLLPVVYYQLLFGSILLISVVFSIRISSIERTPLTISAAAVVSGFAGTTTSVGGPFMAMIYQNENGPRIRGTLSSVFAIGTITAIFTLWVRNRFGVPELLLGLWLTPGIVCGFALSRLVASRCDRANTRTAVLAATTLSAVWIIIAALW